MLANISQVLKAIKIFQVWEFQTLQKITLFQMFVFCPKIQHKWNVQIWGPWGHWGHQRPQRPFEVIEAIWGHRSHLMSLNEAIEDTEAIWGHRSLLWSHHRDNLRPQSPFVVTILKSQLSPKYKNVFEKISFIGTVWKINVLNVSRISILNFWILREDARCR